MSNLHYHLVTFGCLLFAFLASGCSLNHFAANYLSEGPASTFAQDDDPELIAEALPFALKVMESVRDGAPEHEGIHLALASGFTQYAYAFVQLKAEAIEEKDFDESLRLKKRAAKLFMRAYRYGMQGLEIAQPGFEERSVKDLDRALADMEKEQVGLLYWTGLSLAAHANVNRGDTDAIGSLPTAVSMLKRALELNESYEKGSIHEFFITYCAMTAEEQGGGEEQARQHFRRAVELSNGKKASPYIALAESISVAKQDRNEFLSLLEMALAIDPEKAPEFKLVNTLMQQRAMRLKMKVDDLFL